MDFTSVQSQGCGVGSFTRHLCEICSTMGNEPYGSHWPQNSPYLLSLGNLLKPFAHHQSRSEPLAENTRCGIIHKAPIWRVLYHGKWISSIALASKHFIAIVTSKPARVQSTQSDEHVASCGLYEGPSPRLWSGIIHKAPI